MVYGHTEKQSYDLTRARVIVKNMRKNRALADDSDRFSRTYATIARLLKEQMNWLLAVYMAHEHIHTKNQS
jgi:hypothetical protein